MIEILAVVGVLAVLATLAAIGFNVINDSSERRTRVIIESAVSMQTAYENAQPLKGSALERCSVDSTGAEPDPMFASTVAMMDKLLKIPANDDAMKSTNTQNVTSRTIVFPANTTFNSTATAVTLTKPLLLDGWQKPLVWVGTGGLTNLKTTATATGASAALGYALKAPNGRGFWVSAGPDGSFETHDDNVYSYEN